MEVFFLAIAALVLAAVAASALGLLHRQVPTGQALVVGRGATPRVVTAGSVWVIPFLQRVRVLELGLVVMEVDALPATDAAGRDLHARAATVLRVGQGAKRLAAAATALAGKTPAQRDAILHAVLARHLHAVISGLHPDELRTEDTALAARTVAAAKGELAALGAEVVTLTLTEGRAPGT